ncbi:MAG: trypsin-like peptidase domain-containing protein [Chloroflexi bacterium]|nr:trypsin-like peptidase domain-containing protein [Chloroflexota bacterium]
MAFNNLQALSDEFATAVAQAARSVVRVDARHRVAGTGIVWSADGVIVTADHVVEREEGIEVLTPGGQTVKAELIGRDPSTDVAALRVSADGLTAANWSEPAQVKPGHLAFALGKPWDNTPIVSGGIISAVGVGIRGHGRNGFVQSDVVMLPGFSGGPLVDASARVIGLNSSVLGRGVSLAVPVETMRRVVGELMKDGRVKRPYLGVGLQPVPLAPSLSQKAGSQEHALMILTVENGGPAEKGGLLPGDILLAINDKPLQDIESLQRALIASQVGASVTVKMVRGGVVQDTSVTIGAH